MAEIIGYGTSCDGNHLVKPDPSGRGQVRAMRAAIDMAGLPTKDIDHVNVHATSTPAGD